MCKGSMGFVMVLADVLCDSTDQIAALSYHKHMRLNCIWLYSLPGYTFCLRTARLLCAPQPPQAMREATSCTRRSSYSLPGYTFCLRTARLLCAPQPPQAMREATSCTRRSSSRKPWRCTTRSAGRMLVAASLTEA